MTAASLGIAHQRSGSLTSVAGTFQCFAEVRDRLLVAAFTAELTEKLPDWIAPVDIHRQLELEPLHDAEKVVRVGRVLRGGRSAENGARDEERQEQSQPGNARARHADAPVRLWQAGLYPQEASASSGKYWGMCWSTCGRTEPRHPNELAGANSGRSG